MHAHACISMHIILLKYVISVYFHNFTLGWAGSSPSSSLDLSKMIYYDKLQDFKFKSMQIYFRTCSKKLSFKLSINFTINKITFTRINIAIFNLIISFFHRKFNISQKLEFFYHNSQFLLFLPFFSLSTLFLLLFLLLFPLLLF